MYCRSPTLGSTVHHVSVPGSVADMHRLNKIDIKNYTFINSGENTLQSSYLHSLGYWPYDIHRSCNTTVLQRRGSFSTGNLECRRKTYPNAHSYIFNPSSPCVVTRLRPRVYSCCPSLHGFDSSILVCAPVAFLPKT